MRHCCSFDALDIWYLKDDEKYCNKVFYIGFCPKCQKPVVELVQQNKHTHTYSYIKKVGPKASEYAKELIPEKLYASSDACKSKFKTSLFGWRYGLNKEIKLCPGVSLVEQYAVDFYGNQALVKSIN